MNSSRQFPRVITENLMGQAYLDDNYGTHAFRLPSTNGSHPVVTPFDHDFSLFMQQGGLQLAPCRIGSIPEERRSAILRLLESLGLVRGKFVNLFQTPCTKLGYVAHGSRKALEQLLPNDTIEEVGPGWLVTLGERTPIHREVTVGNVHTVQHPDERRESLLSPALREILQKLGKIVYESDPRDADRLVISVKHIHGISTTAWELDALDPAAKDSFMRHQQSVTEALHEAIQLVGSHKAKLFLETFPDPRDSQVSRNGFSDFLQNCTEVIRQAKLLETDPDKRRDPLLLGIHSNFQYNAVPLFASTFGEEILHGDGRFELDAFFRALQEATLKDLARIRSSGRGVGEASFISRDLRRVDDYVMNMSHRNLTNRLAQYSSPGSTSFVVYGFSHFESGYQYRSGLASGMESYFSFLPKTQVIVVEPHDCISVLTALDEFSERLKALPEEMRTIAYGILCTLEELSSVLPHALHGEVGISLEELRKIFEFFFLQLKFLVSKNHEMTGQEFADLAEAFISQNAEQMFPAEYGRIDESLFGQFSEEDFLQEDFPSLSAYFADFPSHTVDNAAEIIAPNPAEILSEDSGETPEIPLNPSDEASHPSFDDPDVPPLDDNPQ